MGCDAKFVAQGKILDCEWNMRKLRIKSQVNLVTSMCWTTTLNSALEMEHDRKHIFTVAMIS